MKVLNGDSRITDFIETYKLPNDLVDDIVEWFEKHNKYAEDGTCGDFINKDYKDSKDITVPYDVNDKPFETFKNKLHECIVDYSNKYDILNTRICRFGLIEGYNLQKYPIGGGFKVEHCERMGQFDRTIKRVLVFMTYLNDLEDGGTEFIYQNKIVKAEKGKTVIWPSDWTHTHRGQVSHTKEKMIITGWYSHLWDT